MENHEVPHYAAILGIETLELLWDNRCWIMPDIVMDREIIKAAADKMLKEIHKYKPNQVIKQINISTEYLSIITIEDGLMACKELLSKPRFHANLGTDINVSKIVKMVLGEVRFGRNIANKFEGVTCNG